MVNFKKILWEIFMSDKIRWVLFFSVTILNFVAYYQDPTRYTVEKKCLFNTPCKWFDFVAGLGTFTLDTLTFIGLWYTIGSLTLRQWLPDYWYLPFIILGYAIITQITIDSGVVSHDKEVLASPPAYLWSHNWRIGLYTLILIVDVIIFIQLYIDSGINNYSSTFRVVDMVFTGRFGGWTQGNKVQFMFAWLGILGVLADMLALYFIYIYNACQYNLPISWNY